MTTSNSSITRREIAEAIIEACNATHITQVCVHIDRDCVTVHSELTPGEILIDHEAVCSYRETWGVYDDATDRLVVAADEANIASIAEQIDLRDANIELAD